VSEECRRSASDSSETEQREFDFFSIHPSNLRNQMQVNIYVLGYRRAKKAASENV